MNAVAHARPDAGTNIVALVEATPVIVLTDKAKFSAFYTAMKAECDAHTPDLTTEAGRKRTASLAYKVARTKTAIDDAGKKLNEEARARINAVDESRREIRQQLDSLKDEVRKPLTDWEVAEDERKDKVQGVLELLRESAVVGYEDTTDDVRRRILHVERLSLEEGVFQSHYEQAIALRDTALATLNTIADRMDQEEAQKAELEKLRAEAAERERLEEEKALAAEAERQRAAKAKAEEESAAAAKEAQAKREAEAAKQAEDRAREEAEAKARKEQEAADAAHAEALAAEKRRADDAEAAAKAERERIEQAEREQKAREADREHRGKVMRAAKEAIMEAGPVDEALAKTIVLAIAAGNVPHVSIQF